MNSVPASARTLGCRGRRTCDIQSIGKREAVLHSLPFIAVIYRHAEGFTLPAVQNASSRGTRLFGACLKHILEREGRLYPFAGCKWWPLWSSPRVRRRVQPQWENLRLWLAHHWLGGGDVTPISKLLNNLKSGQVPTRNLRYLLQRPFATFTHNFSEIRQDFFF